VQTQKDHVDAHAFLMGRMTSALVIGDADHPETPAKRAWTGLLIGLVVALLIAAGFFVFGLIASSKQSQSQGSSPVQTTATVRQQVNPDGSQNRATGEETVPNGGLLQGIQER
jgi:hypothetical protein